METPLEAQPAPRVSVIMSNYRGGRYLGAAIESVLGQSVDDLELIVVDDASGDDSRAVVEAYHQRDRRVRFIALETNLGPAGARNRGIEAARGTWLSIVDNDDLIHPDRLRILLDAADRDGADIVADDLLIFHEDSCRIDTMLREETTRPFWVTLPDFVRSNAIHGRDAALGYCKPLIRREGLGSIRYDESLRIGEDAKLLVELLAAGRRFRIYPWLLYLYRKHSGSISYRLSEADSQRLIRSEEGLRRTYAGLGPEVAAAHDAVLASLKRAAAFAVLIDGVKTRSPTRILRAIRSAPTALLLLRLPVLAVIERRAARRHRDAQAPALLALRSAAAERGRSDGAARRKHVIRLFRQAGYSVTSQDLGASEPGQPSIEREDCLRVARHARVAGNVLVVDSPLGPAVLPYLIDADGPTLELTADGLQLYRRDATAPWPMRAVIAVSIPPPVATAPAPGQDGTVLIVGERTAVEIAGLRWFLAAVWPRVRARFPDAVLWLGGGLAQSEESLRCGVSGIEASPDRLAGVGIVVFPRTIRLETSPQIIEVVQQGKAVVATRAALDGLPGTLAATLCGTDTPAEMAERVAGLLHSSPRRSALAEAARADLGSAAGEAAGTIALQSLLVSPRAPANGVGIPNAIGSDLTRSGGPIEKRL